MIPDGTRSFFTTDRFRQLEGTPNVGGVPLHTAERMVQGRPQLLQARLACSLDDLSPVSASRLTQHERCYLIARPALLTCACAPGEGSYLLRSSAKSIERIPSTDRHHSNGPFGGIFLHKLMPVDMGDRFSWSLDDKCQHLLITTLCSVRRALRPLLLCPRMCAASARLSP